MTGPDRFPRVEIASADALRTWLEAHDQRGGSVWLVTYKKHAGTPYVSREEVLDALIAHGWVDGVRRRLDDARTMQLISPRRQQVWTESYRRRADRLEAEGRMRPRGRAAVAHARAIGTWDALPDVDALVVPDDLETALDAADATVAFASAAPSYRRNVLRWIAKAKTQPTRAKRIALTVAHARAGTRVPQM